MSRPRTFRGRSISWSARYPRVYFPEHPTAMADGMAYIHRVVAWEPSGCIPEGYQVHHKDGDVENWDPDNLEVLAPGEHVRRHRPPRPPQIRRCGACGERLEIRTIRRKARPKVYCSHECVAKGREVATWPEDQALVQMVESEGARAVARQLGVSDTAVRKRLARSKRGE